LRAASNASSPTGASATPRNADPAPRRIAVAYSGGRDSTALLHATLAAAAGTDIEVLALHVHHGLHPNADAWTAHCEKACARWAAKGLPVHLLIERLTTRPPRGASIEAWARDARYAALGATALAHGADLVLLAHHRRDQAETWLLQALRGAGVAGLASMPRELRRDGVTWLRPWLDRPREAIEAYLRRHRLTYVDDDSNRDVNFARNRLRLDVWPALEAAFPQAEASLAAAAAWAQQAAAAIDEWARVDMAAVSVGDALRVTAWLALSPSRRSLSLRAWLQVRLGGPPAASLVVRLLDELAAARTGARWPAVRGRELQLQRGWLRCAAPPATSPALPEATLAITRAGTYALPGWGGRLRVVRVEQGGTPLTGLAEVTLRRRAGAEQFQAGPGRPPRSLKKQYQAAGIAAPARGGPLVYCGDQLLFVPGLGLDARALGRPGDVLVRLEWLPRDTPEAPSRPR
jgi:tRNA(Ile)-lysidine synthase